MKCKLYPIEYQEFPFDEAEEIRDFYKIMMGCHVLFICLEVCLYGFLFSPIVELSCGYVAYYCYNTLSVCAIYGYIALLGLYVMIGFFGILSVILSLNIFPYMIQHAAVAFAVLYQYKCLRDFQDGKIDY